MIERELTPSHDDDLNEIAIPSVEGLDFTLDTWLADSGGSCHMGNSDDGMYDIQVIDEPITLGNGKSLRATKAGKLHHTIH